MLVRVPLGCYRTYMVRKDASDIFSYSEFAIAGDMTKRAFQHLTDANAKSPRSELLPTGGGIRALKRIAVLGGFMSAGVPLLAAARITAALNPELNTYDGEVHSHLSQLAMKLPRDATSRLPSSDDADYWYHRELIRHPDIYKPGEALSNDVVVEIVDKKRAYFVYSTVIHNIWDRHSTDKFDEFARIEGWERGSDVVVIPTHEEVPCDFQHPDFQKLGQAHLAASRAAYRNAVGRVTINLSLAIRNGLDRIARHRGTLPEGGE